MINQIVYEQWTFGDADIHSGSVYIAMSLMSDSLEANTFSATVECADRTILDFQRNTPLTYFFRGVWLPLIVKSLQSKVIRNRRKAGDNIPKK